MTAARQISCLMTVLLMVVLTSCSKSDSSAPPPLEHSYLGTLTFEMSRGFPAFSVSTKLDVSIGSDRTVTFGAGESKAFDEMDTLYQDSTPVTRIRMTGTVHFIEAKGAWFNQYDRDYLLALRHAVVQGQMTVWAWDDVSGWVQSMDTPFNYEDTYDDGETQFSVDEAVLNGSSVSVTIPDVQGETTYSYTLNLTVGLK
jgi:hypothetical protein